MLPVIFPTLSGHLFFWNVLPSIYQDVAVLEPTSQVISSL